MEIKEKMGQLYTQLANGAEMPLLGLGVYDMNGKEAEAAIGTALEIGYRLIDTAAMYGNEKEVGRAVRASEIARKDLFITTKVNNPDQGYDQTLRAFDESSRKLAADYIDLYLVHWPIKGKRKATWQALEHLHRTGRVKSIGVANYLLPFLHELETYAEVPPVANQVEFSPYLYQHELHAYCQQKKIQLQAYSPITKGVKFGDEKLLAIARKYGKTPAQVILRWDMQLGVSAIPKSANKERLQENFSIFDFALVPEDMQALGGFNENLRLVGDPMSML